MRPAHPPASGFVLLLALALSAPAAAAPPAAPSPNVIPTCPSPAPNTALQLAGGLAVRAATAVAWSGREFGAAWNDGNSGNVLFRRFFADGTPASSSVVLCNRRWASPLTAPAIVWNGSGWAVAYACVSTTATLDQVYLRRLDAAGALLGSELKVTHVGQTEASNTTRPALAWSGSVYAVAWNDGRFGNTDTFASVVDAAGTVVASDIAFFVNANGQGDPALAWSPAAGAFVGVEVDSRNGVHELWARTLSTTGSLGPEALVVSALGDPLEPTLAAGPAALGLAWIDRRHGNDEIYFARLSPLGVKFGSDARLTSDVSTSRSPRLAWTGAEFGLAWQDDRSGRIEAWFQRVALDGTTLGSPLQVTNTSGTGTPDLAFGSSGFLISAATNDGANYLQPLGCTADGTPPTCPANLVAYGISGSSATVSWLPATEDASDIAYYEVYRNNTLVGRTAQTSYADTGLALSTTYNYAVRPVNAAQLVNGACADSIYVRTNATLALALAKSGNDISLSWTDTSPLPRYNVYRGTSPQSMVLLGSAADAFTDANAAATSNIYFYSVDEPPF